METMNSDEVSDNLLVNNKIKSEPNLGSESSIMDSTAQDGGQPNMKSEPSNDVPPSLDGPPMKSEQNDFPQSMGDQNVTNDNFNRMNDNIPSSQMSNYNSNFVRGNYMPDQHGGLPGSGNADMGPQPFSQGYGSQGMRTGYPPSSKGPMMPSRPGMSGTGMNVMPPNYSHAQQQRYMSGQSISQQGGPTPTLNQLLQNSSSPQQRYPNFNDYGMNSQKSMSNDGVGNMPYAGGQTWGGQRPQMSGNYPMQPMGNNPAFRNQQRPMFDPSHRRPGLPPNYPQQQGAAPYGGGSGQQQYPAGNSTRFPMQQGQPHQQQQNRPGQMGMGNQNQIPGQSFGQQMGPQFSQSQPTSGGSFNQQQSQSFMQQQSGQNQQQQPPVGQPPQTSQQQPQQQPPQQQVNAHQPRSSTPVSQQPTSTSQSQSSSQSQAQQSHFMQQQLNQQPSSPSQGFGNGPRTPNKQVIQNQDGDNPASEISSNADDLNSDSNSSGGARSTPTSSAPQHLSVGVLRPSRSPSVGSTGSRSNTPASITGNQAGSPMPPRPPSSHVDGQNQMNQSPMANQGYGHGQQMMPPPVGHNQMNFGNKMHPGMMGGQQMGQFPQHNSQFPQQGNFPRAQSPGGMPGYGGQQNSFSNANQMGPNHMFSGGMPGGRNVPSGFSGNSFNQSGMNSMGVNNQYNNFNSHGYSGSGPSPGQNQSPGMPNQINSMNSSHMNSIGMHNQGGLHDGAAPGMPGSQNMQSGASSSSGPTPMAASGPTPMAGSGGPAMSGQMGIQGPGNMSGQHGSLPNMSGQPQMPVQGIQGMPNANAGMPNANAGMPNANAGLPNANAGMPNANVGMPNANAGMPNTNAGMPNVNAGMPNSQRMPGQSGIKGAQAAADAALQAAANLAGRPPFTRPPGIAQQQQQQQQQSPRMFTPQQQQQQQQGQQPNMNFNSTSQNSAINQVMPNHMSGGQMHTLNQLAAQVNSVDSSGSGPTPSTTPVPNNLSVSSGGSPVCSVRSSTPTPTGQSMDSMAGSNSDNSNSGDGQVSTSTAIPNAVSAASVTQSVTPPVTTLGDMVTSVASINSEMMNHDSNSSQSTLVMEDTSEKIKRFQDALSHPPTPVAPSPAASMSSFPDELENISSPSWPGTPKSGSNTDISRLYDMGDEPDRKAFLDHYLAFMDDRGTPLNAIPTISKQPVDLYKMYLAVKERGGVIEVTKAKKWKDISLAINLGGSASAAYTCRKNYMKHMLVVECKLDRNNCDPSPVLAQLEQVVQSNKKESKKSRVPSPASSQNSQDAFRPPSIPNTHMDPFSPGSQRPPSMPNSEMSMSPHMGNQGPMGMMPNSNMPNSGECVSVQDPFADDAVSNQQYPRPSMGASQVPGFPMNQQPSQIPPNSQQTPTPGQQQQQGPAMSNNYNMFNNNRTSMNSMQSFSGNQQQSMINSFSNSNNMSSQQGEHFSGEGFAGRPMGQGNFSQRMPTPEGFSGQQSFGNRMPNQPNQGQFPYRPGFDRERMEQQMMPGQSMKPTPPPQQSQVPVPPTSMPNQPNSDQFPNRFGSPPVRPPQDSINQPSFSGPNQIGNFSGPGPRPSFPGSDQFQQYPPQQSTPQPPTSQSPQLPGTPGMYQGPPKPPAQQQREMFGSAQKRFPDFEKKDGYNVPPPAYCNKPFERVGSYPPYSSGPRPGMMGPSDTSAPPGREQNQWPPQMPPRYPTSHSGPGYPNGPPGMAPNAPNMAHMASFPPRNQRMSPHRDKGFSPGKMPQQQPGMHMNAQYHPPSKKEITFPPDSVEAVQPLLNKRKKINSKDIGPVEGWRLMMALKSGMLAECTWALDTLSILLYDDNSIAYFNLKKMPGLVDCLIEHFRQCLIKVFGEFADLEVGYDKMKIYEEVKKKKLEEERQAKRLADEKLEKRKKKKKLHSEEVDEEGSEVGQEGSEVGQESEGEEDVESELEENQGATRCHEVFKMPESVDEPGNYTLITKKGKPVIIEEHSMKEDLMIDDKSWDVHSDFDSGVFWWQYGRGDMTGHMITHLESRETNNKLRKSFFGPENCEYVDSWSESCEKKPLPTTPEAVVPVLNTSTLSSDEVKTESAVEEAAVKCENTSETVQPDKVTIKSEPMDIEQSDSNCSMPRLEKQDLETKENGDLEGIKQENGVPSVKSEESNSSESSSNKCSERCSNGVGKNSECENKAQDCGVKSEVANGDGADTEKSVPCSETESKDSEVEKKVDITTKLEILVPEVDLSFCNDSFCGEDTPEETPGGLKRKRGEYEEESYHRDEPPLLLTTVGDEDIANRCICISNIIRSLSFVPGNDAELSKHTGLLYILGKLLLLHHRHPVRSRVPARFERDDIDLDDLADVTFSQEDWWWKHLTMLRENTLVIFANMAGQLNLTIYPEELCLPLLDGLLHWAVCPSSTAQDPFPNLPPVSVLSPHRLTLEALCKLCIHEANVDLLLATPPFSRIVNLFSILTKHLSDKKDQVLREFAVVLLSYLVQGDSSAARAVALQHPSVSLLIDFVETAEQSAMQVASMHGVNMLRENPDMMGTSLDMLRRAAMTLLHIARVPENRNFFIHNQSRLLTLVLSQILDQNVAQILADVLFECSQS